MHTNFSHSSRRIPLLMLLSAAIALIISGCGSDDSKDASKSTSKTTASESSTTSAGGGSGASDAEVAKRANSYDAAPTLKLDPKQKYVVELDTDKGIIKIDVDQKAGPVAAANFVALVKDGFYDGVKFHRIIPDFMIQTGDPTGTGMGGPGYSIKDDPVTGEYTKGTVAMANSGPNTGGSQFFIVQGDQVQLGPNYSIFGQVQPASLSVVDKLAKVEIEDSGSGEVSSPVDPVRVKTAKLVSGTLPS